MLIQEGDICFPWHILFLSPICQGKYQHRKVIAKPKLSHAQAKINSNIYISLSLETFTFWLLETPVWKCECLVTTSTVKQETETKSFPTAWIGMKISFISSVADHITQSWLNFLLQVRNLINTLSPTNFLRRLLRFNEVNLEVPMDQYGHRNQSRPAKQKTYRKHTVRQKMNSNLSENLVLSGLKVIKKALNFASPTERLSSKDINVNNELNISFKRKRY